MRVRHQIEYVAMLGLSWTLRVLPRPLALEVGGLAGLLGWALRIRRPLVLANLQQALPDRTKAEHIRIARAAARNFGRTVAEFLRFSGGDRDRLSSLVALEGLESLQRALAEGKGAIVVTAHLGSWALYVTALAAAGIPSALLVGRQHNPRVDSLILDIPGDAVRFIPKGMTSPREVIRALREGKAVVMVADHHPGPRGEQAPFLGRMTSTLSLPGAMAARFGTPLCLLAGHRVTQGTHRVSLYRLPVGRTGDEAADRQAFTVACNQALGERIREHPDQYFWYHHRWRE